MTIQESIVTALAAVAGGRTYPNVAPDVPTTPYIVYSRVSGVPETMLDGTAPLENSRFQLDCYEKSYAALQTLVAAVKAALAAASFKNVLLLEQDLYEQQTKMHRAVLDYSIWH